MSINQNGAKRRSVPVNTNMPVQPSDSGSTLSSNVKTQEKMDYESEEEHDNELDRMLMQINARDESHHNYVANTTQAIFEACEDTDEHDDNVSLSENHGIEPDLSSNFHKAFAFVCDVQHERYELDAKYQKIEAEIKTIQRKVFKLEPRDYWKIRQLEKLKDLSLGLNHELFVAEYAFRDVLDTCPDDSDFNLNGELARLQAEAVELFRKYDGEVLKLREWHTSGAWAEHD